MRRAWLPIVLVLLAAAPAVADSTSINVGGLVRDASDGKALVGIEVVTVDGSGATRAVRTDRHGRFRVIGLTAGLVVVAVQDSIYQGYTRACRVPIGSDANFDFTIYKHARGTVSERGCEIVPPTTNSYVL